MKLENILNAAIRKENFCIPREMVINGSFQSDISGHIAGTVNGDVWVKGRIVILKDGFINGDISADEITVYGRITGEIKNCSKMVIHSGAVIKGNITTSEIHTDKDAIVEGLIIKPGVFETSNESLAKMPPLLSENYKTAPVDSSAMEKQESWF